MDSLGNCIVSIKFVILFSSTGYAGIKYWSSGGEIIKKDIIIKAGDTELTIPFENIKEMEFEWRETPTCTIITNKNERIHGKPIRVEGWSLKGGTNFGDFSLDAIKVKKVIFQPTQIEIRGFSVQDVQKSSETAPEIHIEPIEEQTIANTTVVLSGSASTDSEIESVTVNGVYAGTEYWSSPTDLALGDNNIVIVATGKDGSTTIENISLAAFTSFTPDSKSWISKYIIPNILPLLILLLGTGLFTELIRRYRKRRHKRPPT